MCHTYQSRSLVNPYTTPMPLEKIVAGLTAAIEAISNDEDLRIALGTTE